ncbi:MAG: hypothetical protein V4635_15220 [Bacteroidota bacterium]
MKKAKFNLLLILTVSLCLTACKKKDDKKDEEPVVPPVVTNPPPASGDYWLTTKNSNAIYWTQDFATYHELSSALKAEEIYLSGDTVLFTGSSDFSVKYGPVSNPSVYKTVSSSKRISDVAYGNGFIVALSYDGNNKYLGLCNTKKGETAIMYTLLNNQSYSGLYKIRGAILTNFSTNLGTTLASSFVGNDSLKWMLAPSPGAGNFQYFDGGSGVTVAYDGFLYRTSGTNFNNAVWTGKNISNTNTTDSSGSFGVYNVYAGGFKNINSKWMIYGAISMTSNGHNLHAVNTSLDLGATWQTKLITGVPYLTNSGNGFQYRCLASKNVTYIICSNNNGQNSTAFVYKSTNGIDFTQFLSGSQAQAFYEQAQYAVYVK